jgi:alpha-beta hydrolase superfamily lysophospholipase
METIQLTASDGVLLQCYHWRVAGPRAVVLLLHGLGGHARKYEDVAQFFQQHDIATMAPDLRGHGRSGGKRGHTPSYGQLMSDMELLFGTVRKAYPSTPYFLLGHSYGGNIALNFTLRRHPDIAGLILSSVWVHLAIDRRSIRALLIELWNKIKPGQRAIPKPQASLITRDEEKHAQYIEDPMIHAEATPALLWHATRAGRWALKRAGRLSAPVLVMHGKDDPITDHGASAKLAHRAGNNATLKIWPHKLHELLHEQGRKAIWEYVLNWMEARLA